MWQSYPGKRDRGFKPGIYSSRQTDTCLWLNKLSRVCSNVLGADVMQFKANCLGTFQIRHKSEIPTPDSRSVRRFFCNMDTQVNNPNHEHTTSCFSLSQAGWNTTKYLFTKQVGVWGAKEACMPVRSLHTSGLEYHLSTTQTLIICLSKMQEYSTGPHTNKYEGMKLNTAGVFWSSKLTHKKRKLNYPWLNKQLSFTQKMNK